MEAFPNSYFQNMISKPEVSLIKQLPSHLLIRPHHPLKGTAQVFIYLFIYLEASRHVGS